ncbi:putative ferric-chelate reductase 1 [Lamellibrachia satsuma]|nr:putative ferric-chelate reductase 1 [Lamellibrachia satsuma]
MDGLLEELKDLGIGCYVGQHFCGAAGYADDIILLCPTSSGLRNMIELVETTRWDREFVTSSQNNNSGLNTPKYVDCRAIQDDSNMKVLVVFLWLLAIFHSSLEIDLSGCGVSAGCLRQPNGCTGDSCDVAAIWSKGTTEDTLKFAITAKASGYVSIGFSMDKSMGDDSVIDCIVKDKEVILQPSYNEKGIRHNIRLKLSLEQAGLSLTSSSNTGGRLTCEFTRNISVPGQNNVFDLAKEKYYVMLAYGDLKSDKTKRQHSGNSRILSHDLVNLTAAGESPSSSTGSSRRSVLHKTHGVLMIAAWVVAAATGMFIARHYKTAWPKSTLLSTKVWFVIHRSLMVLAFLCTVAAFIIIFVQVKDYSQFSGDAGFLQAHPPMGIAITALVIINPIMTFFRCSPGAKNRALFDWAHFSVGMSALIMSFINVFSGVKLGGFKDSVMWVMAAYIVFYIIVMVVMEAQKFFTSKRARSNSMEMDPSDKGDPSSNKTLLGKGIKVVPRQFSQSTLSFKYCMLVIFSSVSVGLFAVMLILIIVD